MIYYVSGHRLSTASSVVRRNNTQFFFFLLHRLLVLVSVHLYLALSSTANFAQRNIFMRFYYHIFFVAVSHCLLSCLQSGTVWNTRTYQKYLKVFPANNKFYIRSNAGCEYKGDAIKFANGMEFARLHSTRSGKAQSISAFILLSKRKPFDCSARS